MATDIDRRFGSRVHVSVIRGRGVSVDKINHRSREKQLLFLFHVGVCDCVLYTHWQPNETTLTFFNLSTVVFRRFITFVWVWCKWMLINERVTKKYVSTYVHSSVRRVEKKKNRGHYFLVLCHHWWHRHPQKWSMVIRYPFTILLCATE